MTRICSEATRSRWYGPAAAPALSLTAYVRRRLGRGAREQAVNLLARPFGAPTVAGFWQYWNPVFGYYLGFYLYRPLKALLPRSIATLATFALCGALHDLPLGLVRVAQGGSGLQLTMTLMFVLLGLTVLGTETAGVTMARWPIAARWGVQAAIIYGCWRAAVWATAAG